MPNFSKILQEKLRRNWKFVFPIRSSFAVLAVWSDGYKGWFVNGMLHREFGPAYIGAQGYMAWYVNGCFLKSNH